MRAEIYLSGAVEQHPNPSSWRDDVKERFSYIDWIDPTELDIDEDSKDSVVTSECKRALRSSDAILIVYEEEVPTWGTPIEQYIAWMTGMPIAVWTSVDMNELPSFLVSKADYINVDLGACVRYLSKRT